MDEKKIRPFEEVLFTEIYQLFKSAGYVGTSSQIERNREAVKKVCQTIERYVRMQTIDQIKPFQGAIVEAFKKVEEELDNKMNKSGRRRKKKVQEEESSVENKEEKEYNLVEGKDGQENKA